MEGGSEDASSAQGRRRERSRRGSASAQVTEDTPQHGQKSLHSPTNNIRPDYAPHLPAGTRHSREQNKDPSLLELMFY